MHTGSPELYREQIHKAHVAVDHDLYSFFNQVSALTSYQCIQNSDREAADHDHRADAEE